MTKVDWKLIISQGMWGNCGSNPDCVNTTAEEATGILNDILGNKLLGFNPYKVDDEELVACAERGVWQPFPALTQMVIFHFHDIRKVQWQYPYEGMFLHVGNNPAEIHIPARSLISRATYIPTRRMTHVEVNGKSLTNWDMLERMQHRDYFVSHALQAQLPNGNKIPVYRMFRLMGSVHKRAEVIRRRMIESKIEMLQEVLLHPYSPDYLNCPKDLIDYVTPINAAIKAIRDFPNVRTPEK